MNYNEAVMAMNDKTPVLAFTRCISLNGDWLEYAYIVSIQNIDGLFVATLMDRCFHSVSRFLIAQLKRKEA